MADAITYYSSDISVTEMISYLIFFGTRSLIKGTLNSLHLRQRHQCAFCRDRQTNQRMHHLSSEIENEFRNQRIYRIRVTSV